MTDLLQAFPMVHGHCFLWTLDILVAFVGGSLGICAAYTLFGALVTWSGLVHLRRGTPLFISLNLFLLGAFVFACGFGHLLEAINVFEGRYRIEAYWKVLVALISWAEVTVLWRTRATLNELLERVLKGAA